MKGNLTALIVLLLVQLLLWKGSAIIFPTVNKNPNSSTAQKDSSPQETVKVLNTRLQTTLKGHALEVSSVAITADNKTVISGSADNTIKIWDSETGKLERTITGHTGVVNYLYVTPDGNYIVSAEDKNARIWNRQTGKLIRQIKNSNDKIDFIAPSKDGKLLVIGGDIQTIKNTTKIVDSLGYPSTKESAITKYLLNIFDLKTGTFKNQLPHENPLTKIVVSKSGNLLLSGDKTGKLNIWNLKNGTLQKTLTGHESAIKSMAISPDEKTIVSTEENGQIKIWDLNLGKLKSTFTGHNLNYEEFVEVLIPDNNTLVSWNVIKSSIYETNIKIWNLQTGELRNTIEPPKNKDSYLARNFNIVKVSPDGKKLITTGVLGTHIWELATGQLKDTITIQKDILAFSPDGNLLATSGDANTINIFQMPSGDKY